MALPVPPRSGVKRGKDGRFYFRGKRISIARLMEIWKSYGKPYHSTWRTRDAQGWVVDNGRCIAPPIRTALGFYEPDEAPVPSSGATIPRPAASRWVLDSDGSLWCVAYYRAGGMSGFERLQEIALSYSHRYESKRSYPIMSEMAVVRRSDDGAEESFGSRLGSAAKTYHEFNVVSSRYIEQDDDYEWEWYWCELEIRLLGKEIKYDR